MIYEQCSSASAPGQSVSSDHGKIITERIGDPQLAENGQNAPISVRPCVPSASQCVPDALPNASPAVRPVPAPPTGAGRTGGMNPPDELKIMDALNAGRTQ
jgi:hypothetical protein